MARSALIALWVLVFVPACAQLTGPTPKALRFDDVMEDGDARRRASMRLIARGLEADAAGANRDAETGERFSSRQYNSRPSEYTSDATEGVSPRSRSGLAYLGVNASSPISRCPISLAIPKSSNDGVPSCWTSTLSGLMSRCRTRLL